MKLGATFLLIVLAAAPPEIRHFRYERPVQNVPQHPGQTCLDLDAGTFSQAAPQLADLRLFRDNTEVPYVIHVAAPAEVVEKSIMPLNLGQRAGQTVFDAAMPEGNYSDLNLAVTTQNFIATVAVSGSHTEDRHPETKLGTYTIFDLTRQRLGRSTVLHLPQSDFRHLHFRIVGPLEPQSFTGLSVVRLPASQPKYETVADSTHITRQGHLSIVEFTVPAHVPVDRIVFAPGSTPALFTRDVNVSVAPVSQPPSTDTTRPPRPVTSSGNLLRVHSEQNGHRIDEERLSIDAPGVDFPISAKWTVAIDNGDDAPLTLLSVRLQMQKRDLCFEATPNARYALYYGDPALISPHYDYAALFIAQADASVATLGTEQHNPTYQPRPDERPFSEKHPALLWVSLIAVIVLLGGIALRSANGTAQTRP